MRFALSTKILILPYFLLIIVGLMVPSVSYRGILNPKTLSFFLAVGSLGLYIFLRDRMVAKQLKLFIYTLLSLSFLCAWLLIGSLQDQTFLSIRFDQFKLFLITMTVPIATFYLLYEKKITAQMFYKTVIFANLAYCTLKICAVALHLLGVIDVWKLLGGAGAHVMRMAIFGDLQRLQSSVDIATPFILFFVLQSNRLGLKLKWQTQAFYIFISLLSNFLTFSRFLLAIYALSVALYFFTLQMRTLIKGILIALLVMVACVAAIGVENTITSIERRFFSQDRYVSDRTRVDQIESLYAQHELYPYLGKGVGGYAEDNIRDDNVMHAYEVQWMAFLMQFGLFGLIIICIPIVFIAIHLLWPPLDRFHFSLFCLFMLWILSGFTNPFLISLQSGIIYTLFMVNREKRGFYESN